MSIPLHRSASQHHDAGGCGFACIAPSVGASQRASLGRGIAFVLLLTASSLTAVYVPQVMHGPQWVEGTALATDR